VTCYHHGMRAALVVTGLLLAGCPIQQGRECSIDLECDDGLVCARDHACVDPSEVRIVHASWTINGGPASVDSCQGFDLFISFFGDNQEADSLGFEPVPCPTGTFTVDKLPIRYDRVGLRVDSVGAQDVARFDADGNAQLDLVF